MCSVAAFMLEIEKAEEAEGRQLRRADKLGLSGRRACDERRDNLDNCFSFPQSTSSDLNCLEFILKPCTWFCPKGVRSVSFLTLASAKPSPQPCLSTCNPAAAHKNSHQIIQTKLQHLLQRDTPVIKHTSRLLHLHLLLRVAASHLHVVIPLFLSLTINLF